MQGSFQGTAQAFQASLSSEPYLIVASLVSVYIILGVLYESYVLPLTILSALPSAGVGALLMLQLFRSQLTVISLMGIILLIGIVKKNGIMMVDFAISAERREGLPAPGVFAALPAHLDDNNGSAAERLAADAGEWCGIGTAQATKFRDGGWAAAEPGADVVHDAVIYLYLDQLQHWLIPARRSALPRLAEKMGAATGDERSGEALIGMGADLKS